MTIKRFSLIMIGCMIVAACITLKTEVIVYVSEDQVFSEPVLRDFERETGIKLRALYGFGIIL